MESNTEIHIESAKIQKKIQNHLGVKDENLVFDFNNIDGNVKLDLITINPTHRQSFLFCAITAHNKLEALNKMLAYVKHYKEKENSYTIQWTAKGDAELQTSYFSATNVYDALDKLYFGRDMNTMTVFSIVLNPIT